MGAARLANGAERPGIRRPAPRLVWLIVLAGVAAATGSVTLALTSDHGADRALQGALSAWIILSYIFSGAAAWWHRPESRFGPLMVAAGLVISLTAVRNANAGLPYTLGWTLDLLPAALFLHVYLAFPTGRLQRRAERALVVTAYAIAVGVQIVAMLIGGYGPRNILAVVHEPEAAKTVLRGQLVALSVLLLLGVAVLIGRRRSAGRPARRSIALLVDSFSFALVMIAVLFLTGVFHEASAVVPIQRATFVVLGFAPIALLVGLLHARLARSAVAGLVVELRADPSPAELRDALARALRDESLTLVYWLPEFEGWADLEGKPIALGDFSAGRSTTLIDRKAEHVAALIHDPALDEERELLDAVAAAAGLALENGRLQVELRARLDDLKGSRARLVEAGDSERRRLERNLHDGAQQRLVAIALGLRLVSTELEPDSEAQRLVAVAREDVVASLQELRELAQGLHPAVLSNYGLGVALESVVGRAALPVELRVDVEGRLPPPVEVAAYYLVCEALTNVAKYASASCASVDVARENGRLVVQVADDGVGGADPTSGSGLRGLADRVEALDGRLRVWSPSEKGTTVRAEMPCA